MKIAPAITSEIATREILADTGKVLKVGDILNAATIKGGDTSSKVLLRVGQYLLETRTPVPLHDGQELKLLVKTTADSNSARLPLLTILTPNVLASKLLTPATTPSLNNTHRAENTSIAAVKLRQFISVQQSFSQLQQLSQAVLTNTKAAEQLPPSLKSWLNNAQTNLLINNKGINAAELKQKILNSGIFLEAKQHQHLNQAGIKPETQNLLNSDLKYQLLAIRAELKQFNKPIAENKSSQSLNVQPVTAQQLKQLHNEIVKTGNNTLELSNKLLSLLPASSITKVISLMITPSAQISTTDELQVLAQLLTKVTQQQGHALQKQASLLEQLKLRLMLLELAQQVEQSIQKLNSLQLQPLSREDDNLMLLLFNLVFKDNQQQFDVNFRIEQQGKNNNKDKDNWQITLSFDFKTLGSVQSKIFLSDDQVSTAFYTELDETAGKIQQLLPLLQTGLTTAGLQVNQLTVTRGLPEEKPIVDRSVNLVNEIA